MPTTTEPTTPARPGDSLQRLEEMPPLRLRIHEQLETLITTGVLGVGTRLVEGDLASTLGVSRGPIREALQLLAGDGFVDLRPRQGAFVHVPTKDEIDDFFDIRRALECESARLASTRITPDRAEHLCFTVNRAKQLLDSGEDPSVAHSQIRIHEEITVTARNPVLAQMLHALEKRTTWYRSPFEPAQRRKAWEEHESIVDAIVSGQTDRAISLMAEHIDHARAHLLKAHAAGVDEAT